jgi:DNA polymerase I-like protein with 3'-5' exonuclease and polymerase domains
MEIDDIPQAQLIAEYLLLQKRIAQIKSWFKFSCEDGRVHGYVNSNGTITGRMTHRDPNMAQVPSTRAPYGKECRKCWRVPTGYKLVGIDASGLELRMLAHYMNDEEFTNEILNGDIHTANQKLAGLESRDQAKTFIYALIYGAGNEKLGTVVGGNKNHGKRLRESFLNNLPAFAALAKRVERAASKGYVRGIDGRKIFIRSSHAALNSLLQGAGAIVMKKALVLFDEKLKSNNINAKIVANIHDEWQVEALAQDAELVGELGIDAIVEAGVALELNCPLDGEYNVGDDWSGTH